MFNFEQPTMEQSVIFNCGCLYWFETGEKSTERYAMDVSGIISDFSPRAGRD
jgi:hypothetical protein